MCHSQANYVQYSDCCWFMSVMVYFVNYFVLKYKLVRQLFCLFFTFYGRGILWPTIRGFLIVACRTAAFIYLLPRLNVPLVLDGGLPYASLGQVGFFCRSCTILTNWGSSCTTTSPVLVRAGEHFSPRLDQVSSVSDFFS